MADATIAQGADSGAGADPGADPDAGATTAVTDGAGGVDGTGAGATAADVTGAGVDGAGVTGASGVRREPHVRWITRRRLAKWNRPRHRRDWRWFVSGVGRVLIATGILLFGFVAYQLWGTGFETARSQRALASEFEELLSTVPPPPPPGTPAGGTGPDGAGTDTDTGDTGTGTLGDENTGTGDRPDGDQPDGDQSGVALDIVVERGAPVAQIQIPRIDVDATVVSGVEPDELQKGPGHFPLTPLPGQLGNAAIAGHRTTWGQPFRDVDQLRPGDDIVVTTLQGRFVYVVTGTEIVAPADSHVVATVDHDVAQLTLVSCHPVWSAAQRIIIFADLDTERSSPVGTPRADLGDPTAQGDLPGDPDAVDDQAPQGGSGTSATDDAPPGTSSDEIEDAFARGWFHDPDANPQIALWGGLLALTSILAYGLSRTTRRDLVGFALGIGPFAVAAFFFFQNVNRLLPPGL